MEWVMILGAGMPVMGIWIALAGTLQGAGHTMTSLWINGVSTVLFQVPLCWLLGYPMEMGPFGVWLGLPIAYCLKAALGVWAYRVGRWAEVGASLSGAEPRKG